MSWKKIHESESLEIQAYNQSKFLIDFPILKIVIHFSKYVYLVPIINAICSYGNRKVWDPNATIMEVSDESKSIFHSIFEYSGTHLDSQQRRLLK